MTFAEVIAEATKRLRNTRASVPKIEDDPIDKWIVNNLAEAPPCGVEMPIVDGSDGTPQVVIPDEWGGFWSPQDIRACAAMLLRAADEAEAHDDEDEAP